MNSLYRYSLLLTCLVLVAVVPMHSSVQAQTNSWDFCRLGAFSVEEDFQMQNSEPADGNPTISDGDVLSRDGRVCARNQELLAAFGSSADVRDLGLDALDILDTARKLAAFSTELDSAPGMAAFTAGDLLFTNGARVPNIALVAKTPIRHDIGLDALQGIFHVAATAMYDRSAVRMRQHNGVALALAIGPYRRRCLQRVVNGSVYWY